MTGLTQEEQVARLLRKQCVCQWHWGMRLVHECDRGATDRRRNWGRSECRVYEMLEPWEQDVVNRCKSGELQREAEEAAVRYDVMVMFRTADLLEDFPKACGVARAIRAPHFRVSRYTKSQPANAAATERRKMSSKRTVSPTQGAPMSRRIHGQIKNATATNRPSASSHQAMSPTPGASMSTTTKNVPACPEAIRLLEAGHVHAAEGTVFASHMEDGFKFEADAMARRKRTAPTWAGGPPNKSRSSP